MRVVAQPTRCGALLSRRARRPPPPTLGAPVPLVAAAIALISPAAPTGAPALAPATRITRAGHRHSLTVSIEVDAVAIDIVHRFVLEIAYGFRCLLVTPIFA